MPAASPVLNRFDVANARKRPEGDISSVFDSFSNTGKTLDSSFAALKRKLIRPENEAAVKDSYVRLQEVLKNAIAEIKKAGPNAIPSIDFRDLHNVSDATLQSITNRGCLVLRGVVPEQEAMQYKADLLEYVARNPQTKGFPKDNKVVYELYWSQAQVRARAHPHVVEACRFMNGLWHADRDAEISLKHNVSYADRLRIRQPGDSQFNLGPHADAGSLERWEDSFYVQNYGKILEGKWEEFDPYDATYRTNIDMNKYESAGNCSVFRAFQGWLALSDIAPMEGTILFAPLIKEVTAYWILRPFFDNDNNLRFDNSFPGSSPGLSQEFYKDTHPGLHLDDLMTPVPKVKPGDMVFWHGDMIHAVDKVHRGTHDSSVFYIPAVPLCKTSYEYARVQRESFLAGLPAPDFPGFPSAVAETRHVGRATVDDIAAGGPVAMQEMGFEPIDDEGSTPGEKAVIKKANAVLFK